MTLQLVQFFCDIAFILLALAEIMDVLINFVHNTMHEFQVVRILMYKCVSNHGHWFTNFDYFALVSKLFFFFFLSFFL